jgi:hypothetical protein
VACELETAIQELQEVGKRRLVQCCNLITASALTPYTHENTQAIARSLSLTVFLLYITAVEGSGHFCVSAGVQNNCTILLLGA